MARKMRDSGVEWIGEVPEGWKVHRFKTDVKIFNGCSISDSEKDNYTDPRDAYPYVSTKDISLDLSIANYESGLYTKRADVHFRIAPKGSILMCIEGGSAGRKKCLLKQDVSFVNKLACFTSQTCDNRYVYYFLQSPNYEEHFLHNITGLIGGVNIATLLNMPITIPPLPEQRRIADYLDEKCAAIDGAVDELKRGIEDCKAWKKAIIFEAVTGKANVLAASACAKATADKKSAKVAKRQMRDSGIPWIGEIPEGWEICKALYALSMPITDGPHTTPELFDHGVPFVSAEAVSCGNGSIDFAHIRGYISEVFYQECCQKYIPHRDDIFMIKSGATTGRVAIVDTDERFTIWSPLAVFRVKPEKALPKYFFYMLQSPVYQKQVELGWSYGTQQNIGMRALEQLKILMPPLPEQQAIADYLDEKCAAIDALVAEKEKLIADLEAYKKSLIFELVTGKREVA